MNPQNLVLLILLPLVAWRIVTRLRRSVGRQRLSPTRPWFTVIGFPLFVLVLAAAILPYPARLAALAVGVAGGALLALYGLRKTVFEALPEGLFYTPHALIGAALTLLLVGRLAYRMFALGAMDPTAVQRGGDPTQSPATLAIFGLLAGYYVCYAIGLLRWRRQALAAPMTPPSPSIPG
jgi:hypothetical protein